VRQRRILRRKASQKTATRSPKPRYNLDPGVRIVGQAPLAATVYSLERLRYGACGQVFTAESRKAWVQRSTTKQRRR
jgi:hypothetical protein